MAAADATAAAGETVNASTSAKAAMDINEVCPGDCLPQQGALPLRGGHQYPWRMYEFNGARDEVGGVD